MSERKFQNYYRVGTAFTIVFDNGDTAQIDTHHPQYTKIVALIKGGQYQEAADLADIKAAFQKHYEGTSVQIIGDEVHINGRVVQHKGTQYLLEQFQGGYNQPGIAQFLEKLEDNPDLRVREQLFGFLLAGGNAITEDGDFLAYKKVRSDYTSIADGSFRNDVGTTPRMERRDVDSDPNQTCSRGLHFCSKEYLPHFGGVGNIRVVCLKINPAHVVAIPADYNDTKGRASEYYVLSDITDEYENDPLRAQAVGLYKFDGVCAQYNEEDNEEDDSVPMGLTTGDEVKHFAYGEGTVENIFDDSIYVVFFNAPGIEDGGLSLEFSFEFLEDNPNVLRRI